MNQRIKRSPYSNALNFIHLRKSVTVEQFEEEYKRYSKQFFDDLLKMKMIKIVDNQVSLTEIGYNSLSIEVRQS